MGLWSLRITPVFFWVNGWVGGGERREGEGEGSGDGEIWSGERKGMGGKGGVVEEWR